MSEVFSLWIMLSLVSISSNFPFQVDLNTSPSASLNKEQEPNVLICCAETLNIIFQVSSFLAPGQLDIILSYPPPHSFFSRGLYYHLIIFLSSVSLRDPVIFSV